MKTKTSDLVLIYAYLQSQPSNRVFHWIGEEPEDLYHDISGWYLIARIYKKDATKWLNKYNSNNKMSLKMKILKNTSIPITWKPKKDKLMTKNDVQDEYTYNDYIMQQYKGEYDD